MEKHKLDSLFKKASNTSNDRYDEEANLAKERVWNQIERKKKGIPLFYRVLAVASILLLIFLSISTYSNLQYRSTIKKLVETNTLLKAKQQGIQATNNSRLASAEQRIDTVYIEKKLAISKPIVKTTYVTDTVYIKQIVYLEKDVNTELSSSDEIATTSGSEKSLNYKKSSSELASSNTNSKNTIQHGSSQTDGIALKFDDKPIEKPTEAIEIASNTNPKKETTNNSFQRDIIIINDARSKKKKSNTFKFKLGRKHSKIEKNTIALTTKISN